MRQHTERIHVSTPATSSRSSLKELTFRGIVIGGIITLVFTAANVYLGLKVGLTFATSIPAAVISMAILRFSRITLSKKTTLSKQLLPLPERFPQ